jgi:hypothetical protein
VIVDDQHAERLGLTLVWCLRYFAHGLLVAVKV